MQQVQIPIAGLPLTLVLLSNGCVVVVPMHRFTGLLEQPYTEYWAWFFPEFFSIFDVNGGEDFDYNVMYDIKLYPTLTRWLRQQNLQNPFNV